MSRTCTVCRHEERHAVDTELVQRVPYRTISASYGVSKGALQRHVHEHLPELLTKAREAEQVADADDLLGDIARIRASAFDLLDKAERSHNWKARVAAIRAVRENVRLLGELHGRLEASRQNVTINLIAHPEWIALRDRIIGALREHPQALEATVLAIEAGERNGTN